jgi:hypothetical protein
MKVTSNRPNAKLKNLPEAVQDELWLLRKPVDGTLRNPQSAFSRQLVDRRAVTRSAHISTLVFIHNLATLPVVRPVPPRWVI